MTVELITKVKCDKCGRSVEQKIPEEKVTDNFLARSYVENVPNGSKYTTMIVNRGIISSKKFHLCPSCSNAVGGLLGVPHSWTEIEMAKNCPTDSIFFFSPEERGEEEDDEDGNR